MRGSLLFLMATLPALAGCGGTISHGEQANSTMSAAAGAVVAQAKAQETPEELLRRGEQVFQTVCSACHSMDAPYKAAPPMTHVAKHYRDEFTNGDSAIAHIVSFLQNPSPERSKMPPRAIERFGLMPSQGHLSEDQLRAVATYVWSLPNPAPHD